MTAGAFDTVVAAVEAATGPRKYNGNFLCPAHDDRNPSLSIDNGDGKVLVWCHAGCETQAVVEAVGLTLAQLDDNPRTNGNQGSKGAPIASYTYRNADGTDAYVMHKFADKTFKPQLPNRSGYGLHGTKPVLYRLSELRNAPTDAEVFVVEGEKDADTLARGGFVATSNPFGAGKWGQSYDNEFTNRRVTIVADNDKAGEDHARKVLSHLSLVAESVRVVKAKVDKPKADATDHINAGYGVDEFVLFDVSASESEMTEPAPALQPERGIDGGAFVFDELDDHDEALWGRGAESLWVSGESLLINGVTGTGKTTLGQQIMLGRVGLRDEVLGYAIAPGKRRLLYIAADRPRQARRSLRRMVKAEDRETLDEKLTVWRGPLPFDVAKDPARLAELVAEYDADTVVIDSLKDVALKLTDDETGSGVNMAIQTCLANGIEVVVLHHQRKSQAGAKPKSVDDVYGSTWIASGAGSVLLLWGEPGDPVVELTHLKQPAEPVGPLQVLHDQATGRSSVVDAVGIDGLLKDAKGGLSARSVAASLYNKTDPSKADVEKARRKLERAVHDGKATRKDGQSGGAGGGSEALYYRSSLEVVPEDSRLSKATEFGYLGMDWDGLARMARARKEAGVAIDGLDEEAMRRTPRNDSEVTS